MIRIQTDELINDQAEDKTIVVIVVAVIVFVALLLLLSFVKISIWHASLCHFVFMKNSFLIFKAEKASENLLARKKQQLQNQEQTLSK